MTYSNTNNQSFTIIDAKKIASKLAADLRRMQRFYRQPSSSRIDDFEQEVIELLNRGYLKKVTYGFQKDGKWIEPTLIYTAQDLAGLISTDDDPGRVSVGASVEGASFHSYLIYSDAWHSLSAEEQKKVEDILPFSRIGAPEPSINGRIVQDNVYSSGGKSLNRSSVKKY